MTDVYYDSATQWPIIDETIAYEEDTLMAMYMDFLAASGLPQISADELLFENPNDTQAQWILQFIDAWDRMQKAALEDDREWMIYAEQKSGIR